MSPVEVMDWISSNCHVLRHRIRMTIDDDATWDLCNAISKMFVLKSNRIESDLSELKAFNQRLCGEVARMKQENEGLREKIKAESEAQENMRLENERLRSELENRGGADNVGV